MEKKFVIIIAEDVDVISEATKKSIINTGIDVEIIQTKDGEDTIIKMLEFNPKLLILNNLMPKKTGIEILRMFNEKGIKLPLVFMSTANGSIASECLKLGASRFLQNHIAMNI